MRKTLLSYSPTTNMTTDFAAWAQRPDLMNSLTFSMALTLVCLVCLAELTWSALCLQNFIARADTLQSSTTEQQACVRLYAQSIRNSLRSLDR